MKSTASSIQTGADRINGLLTWWGVPDALDVGAAEGRAKRFQGLVSALSQVVSEASANQAETASATNERLARALRELLGARQPADFIAAQSRPVTDLMETLAAQAKALAEVTQQLHECRIPITGTASGGRGERAEDEAGSRSGEEKPSGGRDAKRPGHH